MLYVGSKGSSQFSVLGSQSYALSGFELGRLADLPLYFVI